MSYRNQLYLNNKLKSTNDFDMQMAETYRKRIEEKRKEKLNSKDVKNENKSNLV